MATAWTSVLPFTLGTPLPAFLGGSGGRGCGGAGKFSTGCPSSAATMYWWKIIAGQLPPNTGPPPGPRWRIDHCLDCGAFGYPTQIEEESCGTKPLKKAFL